MNLRQRAKEVEYLRTIYEGGKRRAATKGDRIEKIIELCKEFALGCVGEDETFENFDKQDNLGRAFILGENQAKQKIRKRIEEATG